MMTRRISAAGQDESDSEFEDDAIRQRARTMDDRLRDALEIQSSRYVENVHKRYEVDCMLA